MSRMRLGTANVVRLCSVVSVKIAVCRCLSRVNRTSIALLVRVLAEVELVDDLHGLVRLFVFRSCPARRAWSGALLLVLIVVRTC